jgi:putative MATE family efflux protein
VRIAHAAIVALALGAATGLVLGIGAPWLVRAFGAVDALVDPSVAYLRVRAVGIPFALLGYVGHGGFRGVSDTRTPLVVVAVANVLNGALNLVLVFGLGFGLAGIAWATVAAEVVAVAIFALLLQRMGLPLLGHGLPSRRRLAELFTVSRDLFLRTGSLLLGLLAVTSAAARTGATTAAAHQVIWQVWIVVSFLMDGFAIAGQAMVGTALGAGAAAEARTTAKDLVRWGVVGGALIAVALIAAEPLIPRLLTDDPATLAAVSTAWWLASGGHVINGLVFVLDGVLMGADDFAYLRRWMIVGAVVAGVGAQVAVSAGAGLLGLWIAVQALMLVRAVSLVLRVRGDSWIGSPERAF